MSRFAWVFALGLLASVPAVGLVQITPTRGPDGPSRPPAASGTFGAGAMPAYTPPKADGPVVELLDEGVEPLFPLLNNDLGPDPGTITREDHDVFAGVEAVRVTPLQKHSNTIRGWFFKIVEKPEKAGEFRYLRLAWKKIGGTGIMIQFHASGSSQWGQRYFAGQNAANWQPARSVADKLPAEWEVVTRDLFKEYGAFSITGMALSPMDGTAAFFDHILLGRTVEDLDKATDAALGRVKPNKPLAGKERDALWTDLLGLDRAKAGVAIRAFLATAPDQVAFIRERLADVGQDKTLNARILKLIADLDADNFDVRESATDELITIGAPAVDAVRPLVKGANDEVRFRARVILKKIGNGSAPVTTAGKMARIVRVLERADSKDACDLLTRMAEGEFGLDAAPDAKAALARLAKQPRP